MSQNYSAAECEATSDKVRRLLLDRTFITYVLVGVLNTAFGYSMFAMLICVGFHYTIAVLIGTLLGVLFNFKTIGKLVFKQNDNSLIFRFVTVYIITMVLNIAGLRLYKNYNDNLYLAGILMLIPLTVISFILHNRFVFRKKVSECP